MNQIREIENLNRQELERGLAGTSASWHSQYAKSPWVFVGNLDHELTEGDVLCVMSQFGEIEDINLAREEDTGKSRGFAFVKYEDARSCVVAVDNFVGVKLCGRSLNVDHVDKYRLPKKLLEQEEAKESRNFGAGHAYQDKELENGYSINKGLDLFAAPKDDSGEGDEKDERERRKRKDRKRNQEKERKSRRKDAHHLRKEEKRRQKRARQYRDDESSNSKDKKDRRKKHKRGNKYLSGTSDDERERRSRRNEKNRRREKMSKGKEE